MCVTKYMCRTFHQAHNDQDSNEGCHVHVRAEHVNNLHRQEGLISTFSREPAALSVETDGMLADARISSNRKSGTHLIETAGGPSRADISCADPR